MRVFGLFVALIIAGEAWAGPAQKTETESAVSALDAEARCYVLPGPDQGETRPVCVWRPRAVSPATPLPVLYVADGVLGLHIVLSGLKAAIDAGTVAPMMVVAAFPKATSEGRADEYLETRSAHAFQIHETWLLVYVIPWAERTVAASNERAKRFIGGVSNGADLALWLANNHADIFSGALVHSPVGSAASWVGDTAATQRWVVTGGTDEFPGERTSLGGNRTMSMGARLPRDIAYALEQRSAPLRQCIGKWQHEARIWRQLSPGSVVWLMGLGTPASVESALEKDVCRNEPF